MKLSTVTTIATVLLLWLLPVMGAHPRKLDPDEVFVQDDSGNWIVCPAAPAPPSPPAPLVPFRFDSSLVNSPITQPAVIPTNVPIRIDHEIDIGNDIRHAQQLFILETSSRNDRFPFASVSASSRPRRRRRVTDDGFDACNLPADTLPVVSSRSRRRVSDEFEACSFDPLCHSIPTPVASASSPDDPEWFDDGLESDDDEPECVDGLKVDDSVAAIDSSQPVPTTEVSINVAATIHLTLH